ncbi:MAG: hypothetical protein ABW069_04550 [Duganella sp.]
MDEVIYQLLLKTGQGLTLPGTLRFRLSSTEPLKRDAADWPALLAQTQQQATLDLVAYALEGSISIPFLTGLRPVPLTGTALFLFIGPLVTAFLGDTDPTRSVFLQVNELDAEHLSGGLVWRSGEPGELILSLLATLAPPAP